MEENNNSNVTPNESARADNFDARDFFKRWPKFYYFIAIVFSPMMWGGVSIQKFLKKYPMDGMTLNLGSGPRVISPQIVNADIFAYPGVSIVADAAHLPLEEGSVGRIISDMMFEHVPNPAAVVKEMYRVLKPGGLGYVVTPFMYPFHSSPYDYQRWSTMGLRELFKDFEIVEMGVRAGPFSALVAYLCHLFGMIFSFGSASLESILVNLFMFVFFPIKLLDLVFNHWPQADKVAAAFYCVVRKI
jgi:SAM-dependent methyltransferase